jgi:hypothetical protein
MHSDIAPRRRVTFTGRMPGRMSHCPLEEAGDRSIYFSSFKPLRNARPRHPPDPGREICAPFLAVAATCCRSLQKLEVGRRRRACRGCQFATKSPLGRTPRVSQPLRVFVSPSGDTGGGHPALFGSRAPHFAASPRPAREVWRVKTCEDARSGHRSRHTFRSAPAGAQRVARAAAPGWPGWPATPAPCHCSIRGAGVGTLLAPLASRRPRDRRPG